MASYYGLVLIVLGSALIVDRIAKYVSVKRFQKANGCKPPHCIPQSECILGWGVFKEQVASAKLKKRLETGMKRYAANGNTFKLSMMGIEFFNTIEPENLKTILASNFKDYNLSRRSLAFGPLLGDGIFTTGWFAV
jgi:hypothetical protein